MATKRHLFSSRLQIPSFLKKYRRLLIILLSAVSGLIFSLIIPSLFANNPVNAQDKTALEIALQGEQYYNAGQFEEAIKLWQQSADAFSQIKDEPGKLKSLINKSQAQQELGLSLKSCETLLIAFAVNPPQCLPSVIDQFLHDLSLKKNTLSSLQGIALRRLGDTLRRIGQLEESNTALQLSLEVIKDPAEKKATLLSLGNTQRALGNRERDTWDYKRVTDIITSERIKILDLDFLRASIDLNQEALRPYEKAFQYYTEASGGTESTLITQIQSQLNYLSLLFSIQKWWIEQTDRRIPFLERLNEKVRIERALVFRGKIQSELNEKAQEKQKEIQANLPKLNPSRASVYARLNLAETLLQNQQTEGVQALLETALLEARQLKDRRGETYAIGYMGTLSFKQGNLILATELTKKALILAQEQNINGDAREITYLWQSQLGTLLKQQGDIKGAIAAYIAAYNTLQSLRSDLVVNNRDVQFDFRDEVKPVYIDLADLLLKNDISQEDLNSLVLLNPKVSLETPAKQKPINRLELARQVIESLQLAELDNFFQDPCSEVTQKEIKIDDIDPDAAVIYPIVLPDRLEILLSVAGKKVEQITVNVNEQKLNTTLDTLYDLLDNQGAQNSARNIISTNNPFIATFQEELTNNYRDLSAILTQLNSWLVDPLASKLDPKINTLVFVFNDRLQRVPIAALYDGQEYLIQKYALAVVPSLQLIKPRQLQKQQWKILAGGVSEKIQLEGVDQPLPALVNVRIELDKIKQVFPDSQELFNETFTAENIENRLKQVNFSVVHLSTHGFFSSNPKNNFIVTGDQKTIGINQLSDLLNVGSFGAPELLVLSACDTATGDERAVLGLAGMAVRSGSRSTLASLWPVIDDSTAEIMGQFYKELTKPSIKKAEALRQSQLLLMEYLKNNPRYQQISNLPPHPYYWAPYVLVGNWQ